MMVVMPAMLVVPVLTAMRVFVFVTVAVFMVMPVRFLFMLMRVVMAMLMFVGMMGTGRVPAVPARLAAGSLSLSRGVVRTVTAVSRKFVPAVLAGTVGTTRRFLRSRLRFPVPLTVFHGLRLHWQTAAGF